MAELIFSEARTCPTAEGGCPVSSVWQFGFWNSASLYYSLFPALENMEQGRKCAGLRLCLIIPLSLNEGYCLREKQKPKSMMMSSNDVIQIFSSFLLFFLYLSRQTFNRATPFDTKWETKTTRTWKKAKSICNHHQIMISNFSVSIHGPAHTLW